MTLQQKLVQADDYLDMLKDKARETDELAKENLQLRTDYQQANDIIVEQNNEIERLKDELDDVKAHYETEAEAKYYEFIDNHESKLQQRINKAIEYIEEEEYVDYNPTLDGSEDDSYMKLPRSLNLLNEELDILLDILKGDDKE